MKWILFLIPSFAFATTEFITEQRIAPESDLIEFASEEPEYNNKRWSLYLYDRCNFVDRNVQNETELRSAGLRRCKDGSVSFVQPESDGWNGWEGKCGPTAASNSLYHLCKKGLDPNKYVAKYMNDATPGVRPGTLKKGLRTIFNLNKDACPVSNNWVYGKLNNVTNYIAKVKQDLFPKYSHPNLLTIQRNGKSYFRNPILTLIQNPGGKYLHWVTIVDIISSTNRCDFVVNHWNKQYLVPCKTLASWSGKVGKTYPIILKSYSVVTYK